MARWSDDISDQVHQVLVGWIYREQVYCVEHNPRGVAYAAMRPVYDNDPAAEQECRTCGMRLLEVDQAVATG